MTRSKQEMARLAALEISDDAVVNLGIGLPTLIADQLPAGKAVWFQSENGILGMGPFPEEGQEDPMLINAGKQTVTIVPGGSTFDSSLSFAMIRGGHVDIAFLGAMQVSCGGDLANWAIPGGRTMGIGGAMDLAAGARRVIVVTSHLTKEGEPKLLAECDYPLTATRVVSRVFTDMATLDCAGDHFVLVSLAEGITLDQLRANTGAEIAD